MKKWRFIIKSIFLLVWCGLYFFVRGRADKKTTDPKRILVVQLAKLGDMACTTPVFRAIKSKYPQSRVYVLGNAVNKILLDNHPDVDSYIVFSNDIFGLLKSIKKERFDFACLTLPDFFGLVALYLAGIPLICAPKIVSGYSPYNTKSFRWLAKLAVTRDYGVEKYAPREYLKLLEPIGIHTGDTKKSLAFSSSAKEKTDDFFLDHGINPQSNFIIGLSPAAGNRIKLWDPAKFADLINYIQSRYRVKIVIIGDRADESLVAEVTSRVAEDKENQAISTVGIFNLEELKALISKMSMFISVDTGPIYIAEAFGVPTIDIVGPVDENVQPPVGDFNMIVKAEREKAEVFILNSRDYDYQEAKRQIDEISVEMTIEQFEKLVEAVNKSELKNKILPLK